MIVVIVIAPMEIVITIIVRRLVLGYGMSRPLYGVKGQNSL